MPELKRLNEILKLAFLKKGIFKKAEMAEYLGYKNPYFSGVINGKEKLSDQFLKNISDKLGVNSEWILTGDGDQYLSEELEPICGSFEDQELIYVPLLPISAQGGSLNDFIVSVKDSDCEKIISPVKGADFAITVAGDSMAPEYTSGSQILIKKINERAFIDWGKTYVIDTCNGTVIKILVPSKNEGFVRCLSINPDPKYAPFEIAFEDIYGIYRVMLCMSSK